MTLQRDSEKRTCLQTMRITFAITGVLKGILLSLLFLSSSPATKAQHLDPITEWTTKISYKLVLHHNVVYHKAGGIELQLDVITAGGSGVKPVVIYFHGGGWVAGNKDGAGWKALPYLAQEMAVVNVDYRLASQALAPAAVEDGRCALQWVYRHATQYGFDIKRIVVAGESAGGHLALMTGMLTPAAGLDNACEVPFEDWQLDGPKDVRVAAIINFFGPVELTEFIQTQSIQHDDVVLPMPRNFALRWFGDVVNRIELAKRLSRRQRSIHSLLAGSIASRIAGTSWSHKSARNDSGRGTRVVAA
jgi:acetyl esterase/lipase